jgi:hypothetical protein
MLLLSISILSPPYLYGIGYPVYYRSLGLPGGIELSFFGCYRTICYRSP